MSSANLLPRTSQISAPIPANRVSEATISEHDFVLQTCDRIVRLKIPNMLRLYLNPFVAQTCVALNDIVHALWPATKSHGAYPAFLANSGEEALSGAIKLARYTQHQRAEKKPSSADALKQSTRVFLVDDGDWFEDFAWTTPDGGASETASNQRRVEFIPDVVSLTTFEFVTLCESQESFTGIVVISPTATRSEALSKARLDVIRTAMRKYPASETGVLVTCMNSERLHAGSRVEEVALMPDIVVFDETFTMRQVPFGAFAARPDLYAQWTAKGMSTFHSTTYQPNTISTMHFLKCLDERFPDFFQQLQSLLKPLLVNRELLKKAFRDLFNPALMRLISAAGFDGDDVTVSGHYVRVDEKRYFDGI